MNKTEDLARVHAAVKTCMNQCGDIDQLEVAGRCVVEMLSAVGFCDGEIIESLRNAKGFWVVACDYIDKMIERIEGQVMSKLVKVRLLNNGGYVSMSRVQFPVCIMAEIETVDDRLLAYVSEADINAIDGCEGFFCDYDDPRWPFIIGRECEIIND